MSLLTATQDDLRSGRGRQLPDRVWRGTVIEAVVEKTANGSRISTRISNLRDKNGATEITLPDGSTFTPGRRIVFDRQWVDHENPDAVRYSLVKKQAISAGLMPIPAKGKTAELDFDSWDDYAAALIGRDVLFRSRQVRAQTKNAAGVYVDAFEDADGNTTDQPTTDGVPNTPKFNVQVADYLVDGRK